MALVYAGSSRQQSGSDEAVWDSHKETLRELYLLQDKTLSEVMRTMETMHGFYGTKKQYERHLNKEWNFRKKLKKEDWKAIGHYLKKRKRTGKESDVVVDGAVFSSKKVRKETQRYDFEAALQPYIAVPSPKLPAGIDVCTPPTMTTPILEAANLPFATFTHQLLSRNMAGVLDTSQQLVSWARKQLLAVSMAHVKGSGPVWCASLQRMLDGSALVPEALGGSLINAVDAPPTMAVLRTMMFLLSNNISSRSFDLRRDLCEKFLDECLSLRNAHFIAQLLSIRSPTVEAFAEHLFSRAMHTEREEAVKALLQYGIDPNAVVFSKYRGRRTKPLLYAIDHGDLKLVQILLDYGASLDPVHYTAKELPLHAALSAPYNRVEMIELLLLSGAPVDAINTADPHPVLHTLLMGMDLRDENTLAIFHILIKHGADLSKRVSASSRLRRIPIEVEIGATPLDLAAIRGRLDICDILLQNGATLTTSSLCYAVAGANADIFQRFLRLGAKVTSSTARGQDALKWAVHHQDLPLVEFLLHQGANVNNNPFTSPNCEGSCDSTCTTCRPVMSALQIAYCRPDPCLGILKALLDFEADVHAPPGFCLPGLFHISPDRHYNAIQAAARFGNVTSVAMLLAKGVSLQVLKAVQHDHPICLAATYNSFDVLRMLIEYDRNALHTLDVSPLPHCVLFGKIDAVQMLLQVGAYVNKPCSLEQCLQLTWYEGSFVYCYNNALIAAIQTRNTPLAVELIARGADINSKHPRESRPSTPLSEAAAQNDHDMVCYLLSRGASDEGGYALERAFMRKASPNLLRTLLLAARSQYGRHAYAGYWCGALKQALSSGDSEAVDALLNADMNLNLLPFPHIESLLEAAVSADEDTDYPLTRKFLAHGVNASGILACKRGALVKAIRNPYVPILPLVELLVAHGVDPSSRDRGEGRSTALQAACLGGHLDIIRLLLDAGADVNAAAGPNRGMTALQAAAIQGFLGVANLLLERGADVNAAGAEGYGRTALEGAAEHGRIDMLQLLINTGVDLGLSGEEQREVAIGLAHREGHHAAARLIISQSPDNSRRWTDEEFRRFMSRRD